MNNLYIVNYRHESCLPFQSITRLPEREAYTKANELSCRHTGISNVRFADFHNYYPRRIKTEKWLYHQFLDMGGEPETPHPLYFVLQGNQYLKNWFENGLETKIYLESISAKHISFTFGDSCAEMDNPKRKPLFSKTELYNLVREHGDVERFLANISLQYTYIEAQLWSDDYVTKINEPNFPT